MLGYYGKLCMDRETFCELMQRMLSQGSFDEVMYDLKEGYLALRLPCMLGYYGKLCVDRETFCELMQRMLS